MAIGLVDWGMNETELVVLQNSEERVVSNPGRSCHVGIDMNVDPDKKQTEEGGGSVRLSRHGQSYVICAPAGAMRGSDSIKRPTGLIIR